MPFAFWKNKRAGTSSTLEQYQFAAVDVETTGLYPNTTDRIIEFGAVLFRLGDGITGEFQTLINPHRDAGKTSIHGIEMAQLSGAPTFDAVAPEIVDVVRNRVLVAHNAQFDMRFLTSEFNRSAITVPPLPHVCTMQLADRLSPGRLRLVDVCDRMGVRNTAPHTAIGDARATAEVLLRWHRAHKLGADLPSCGCSCEPTLQGWPEMPMHHTAVSRTDASVRAAAKRGYLGRLIDQLPTSAASAPLAQCQYLDTLERAIEDRFISAAEAEQLAAVAAELGLTPHDAHTLHTEFFEALTVAAWEDGIISPLEQADLRLAGEFLNIPANVVAQAIRRAPKRRVPTRQRATLEPGASVCFTGEPRGQIKKRPITRPEAEQYAANYGLEVRKSVTKKLDVLVVADPESEIYKGEEGSCLWHPHHRRGRVLAPDRRLH